MACKNYFTDYRFDNKGFGLATATATATAAMLPRPLSLAY